MKLIVNKLVYAKYLDVLGHTIIKYIHWPNGKFGQIFAFVLLQMKRFALINIPINGANLFKYYNSLVHSVASGQLILNGIEFLRWYML